MEKNDEKRQKIQKHCSHAKSSTISRFTVVVVTFFVKILDDFHDFVSECVSFPMKINNPFWGVIVFQKKSDNFPLDAKQKHTFYRRKSTKKIAKVSPSNNNYFNIIQQQQQQRLSAGLECILLHRFLVVEISLILVQWNGAVIVRCAQFEGFWVWRSGAVCRDVRFVACDACRACLCCALSGPVLLAFSFLGS